MESVVGRLMLSLYVCDDTMNCAVQNDLLEYKRKKFFEKMKMIHL